MAALANRAPDFAAAPPEALENAARLPRRLRVGVFAATRRQPRVLVDSLAEIAASPYAEIVVIVVGERGECRPSWLWRLYQRLDARLFGIDPQNADAVDLCSSPIGGQICPLPAAGTPVPESWRADISRLRLDVALLFDEIDDKLLDGLAGLGSWRFDFGCPPGFEGLHEVIDGQPTSSVRLKIRLPSGQEKLLDQSCTRTARFSLASNRQTTLRRAGRLLSRALDRLHQCQRAPLLNARPLPHLLLVDDAATAGNAEALAGMGRMSLKMLGRGLEKLRCVDQWLLAWRFAETPHEAPELGEFSCLTPPRDRFWADPFPLLRDGRHYIFFEELVFAEGKAHIAVVEIAADGICAPPRRVLERPYHLSYPCLIESGGELFMVPESGLNGTVELYRCTQFPDCWQLVKVLLKVPCCADATFHQEGDRWWMFVNIGRNDQDVHDELFLYSADRLDGEWLPHPANPIKSDVRSARPAGRMYRLEGELFRPAQIGVPLYGAGISLNRVLKLNAEEYSEEEVGRILPPGGSGLLGIHTINRAGNLVVVDAFTRRFRLGGRVAERFVPLLEQLVEAGDALS